MHKSDVKTSDSLRTSAYWRNVTSNVEPIDVTMNTTWYAFIAVFLLMDILLLGFRMAWLYTQIQEAKQGCEVLMPQDDAARKVLKMKTGQNPPRQFDLVENGYQFSEHMNEGMNQENELNVYFCQSYPRSKEDILRDIWAQKMQTKTKGKEKLHEYWLVQDLVSVMCWLQRAIMSKLVWRFLYTSVIVIFVCCVMHVLDSYLSRENFMTLVGVNLVVSELEWQVDIVNRHVATVAQTMNQVLRNMKLSVDLDIDSTNTLLFDTWEKQLSTLSMMMSSLCNGTELAGCDLSFLRSYHHAPLSSCNFLPIIVHQYNSLDIVKLQNLVESELSPLLNMCRSLVYTTSYVVITILCARITCQIIGRVVKDYLIITGRIRRTRIYQFSNTMTGMSDDPRDPEKEIHRSASWLESCESGVYVGENDDSNRESTI